ncbi:laccase-7-like [Neltuma alba]|uniref:laccase-7-like n=1 Tax=Neltuma alba TaxID=207710 RepID=UPI0010A47AAA|nr:laccase-7-like [Prosopis alba]
MKACLVFSLLALLAFSFASAAVVEHSFIVKDFNVSRLCNTQTITAVNGMVPGPTIDVRENDSLVIHVFNGSPHNITLHWHGVFQIRSQWADGPEYITQCPIRPGHKYTYRFTVTGQEGTLWWHAHSAFLRTYVHGALIIRPRTGCRYPFPKPHKEVPIILGEWWTSDINQIFDQIQVTGGVLPISDAFTINGMPGDLYNCPQDPMFKFKVKQGKTYFLRIINTNLVNQMFFRVAYHTFTVVAVDAGYTTPYVTDVVVIAPGQTTDVLLKADQPVGSYYMASSAYVSTVGVAFDNTTTRGIVVYKRALRATPPVMPVLPAFNDTPTAHRFYTNLTGLVGGPHWIDCPLHVDEHMFITIGLNLDFCANNATCLGPLGFRFSSSMNNESFVTPSDRGMSMLEAFFRNKAEGVYTRDFPDFPPQFFDFVSPNISLDLSRIFTPKSTKVKRVRFDSTVEIVFQNTAFLGIENHPMHIHGFDFYVLGQGFGVFNATRDHRNFNLVNPQRRNTIAVPTGGWAVIRFKANNPGIWFVHCHIDAHLPSGLAMAFEVENGPTPETSVPPPPADLPRC